MDPKCSGCRKIFEPETKPNGQIYKQCLSCREKGKKYRVKCPHGRQKYGCRECKGSQICIHDKRLGRCLDCGGNQICSHGRDKGVCRECKGSQICVHNRQRSICKDCGGGHICPHNLARSICRDCRGSQICVHNRIRTICKECLGGGICEHKRRRSDCKDCMGGNICKHQVLRRACKICNLPIYLVSLQRKHVRRALEKVGKTKDKRTVEYLGCSPEEFKEYIEDKIRKANELRPEKAQLSWDNIHLDHIKPVSKFDLKNPAEFAECCHYTNFQPLLSLENLRKSNKWSQEEEKKWKNEIIFQPKEENKDGI